MSRLRDRVAASAVADGLDSGRASATMLVSGECMSVGSVLHTQTKSVTNLACVGGHLLGVLLDGVRDWGLLDCRRVGNVAAECVAQCRCAVREDLGVVCAP